MHLPLKPISERSEAEMSTSLGTLKIGIILSLFRRAFAFSDEASGVIKNLQTDRVAVRFP